MKKRKIYLEAKDNFFILLGILLAGFGLESFLVPNGYIDGGITGISLLLHFLFQYFDFSVILFILNLPFIFLAWKSIGKKFAIKSILSIAGLALVIKFIHFPHITEDKLLIAVFGGLFLGSGIGLAIRGGSVLDGTEVLAIYISRITNNTISDVILFFNIIIFLVAAYLINIETALYAILTYYIASRAVTYFIEGVEECTGVSIISNYSEEIRKMIINQMKQGVTLYKAKSGYGEEYEHLKDIYIVFTVVSRLEISKLRNEIENIDPQAFIIMNNIIDVHGGLINRSMKSKH